MELIENINDTSHHICSEINDSIGNNTIRIPNPKNSKKIQSVLIDQTSPVALPPSKLVVKEAFSPPCQTREATLLEHNSEGDLRSPEKFEPASLSIPSPNTLKYLFRSHIPIDYLYDVLEKICVKKEKYYIIDFNSYRLLQFHDLYTDFAERIIQAYKPSKQKYVTRTLTYNSFVTIVRHICRINGIPFDTKFNYQYSLYNIDYYIYFTYHPTPSLFPPMLSR